MMAVNVIEGNGQLVVELATTGTDGRTVIQSKTYTNLKAAAIADDVYAVGQAFGALQQKPVSAIKRISEAELVAVV